MEVSLFFGLFYGSQLIIPNILWVATHIQKKYIFLPPSHPSGLMFILDYLPASVCRVSVCTLDLHAFARTGKSVALYGPYSMYVIGFYGSQLIFGNFLWVIIYFWKIIMGRLFGTREYAKQTCSFSTSIPGQCICRFSLTNTHQVLSETALGSRLAASRKKRKRDFQRIEII